MGSPPSRRARPSAAATSKPARPTPVPAPREKNSQKSAGVRRKARKRPQKWLVLLGGAFVSACVLPLCIVIGYAFLPGPGTGKVLVLETEQNAEPRQLSEQLAAAGLVSSANFFRAYLGIVVPHVDVAGGSHILNDGLTARELVQRLSRLPARKAVKVTIPEGFNYFQIADRLEHLEVCTRAAFQRAVSDEAALSSLDLGAKRLAEGYLFPATYELRVDSAADEILRILVHEHQRRFKRLRQELPAQFERVEREFGFGEYEILTLASMVERESGDVKEQPLIAAVFFNRLRDPEFRPLRMLQSDPTAGYGCLVLREALPSCSDFRGNITPALLRDGANPYNTYRHPGLPPTPIANPGEAAIRAVLEPAPVDYLYFFAKGGGKHGFSRTFAEHRSLIDNGNGTTRRPE